MAFRSNGPVQLTLPPFRGMTRRLVLTAVAVFFAELVLALVSSQLTKTVIDRLWLHPDEVIHGQVWQLFSYPFMSMGLLSLLFASLTIWTFGWQLEDERGPRWFLEYFLCATAGGGVLTCVLAFVSNDRVPGIAPGYHTSGLWPGALAILLAFALFHPDETIRFNFLIGIKAKYLAAIYVLFYLGSALSNRDAFSALVMVMSALCGFLYIRLAPRQGIRYAVSESWYGVRNAYYRNKRRRAAKKFEVYMRQQGRDVHVNVQDKDDRNDRRWMN